MTVAGAVDIDACRRSFRRRIQRRQEQQEKERRRALRAVRRAAPVVLAAYSSVARAYVFGSVTQPAAFHARSDVDIALEGATVEEYFAGWRDLDRALSDWTVDVRELEGWSSFASRICQTGVLIYERETAPAAE